jgi:hypothetical protein
MVAHPTATYMDELKQILCVPCHPTDSLSSTLHATGMGTRIGDKERPLLPLLDHHVRHLDHSLWMPTTWPPQILLTNGIWLGVADTVLWKLSVQHGVNTKLSHGMACRWISWLALASWAVGRNPRLNLTILASGYSPGKWFHHARCWSHVGKDWEHLASSVFTSLDGMVWTSLSF